LVNPYISIVIPAFNEEERIIATLEDVVRFLSGLGKPWEVIVADDGSTDGTAGKVRDIASRQDGIRLLSLPHRGKGAAVKDGMLASTGEYRFMCDADLAMPIDGLSAFLERMEEGYDIVIGSRQVMGARRFNETAARHFLGRLFNWSVRLLAVGGFQDTQCGFKCFKGDIADELFGMQKTAGFVFDVEILYLASRRGLSVLEMPIDWYHRRASKVRPGIDSFVMLREMLRIRWNWFRGRYSIHPESRTTSGTGVSVAAINQANEAGHPSGQVNGDDPIVTVVVPTYNEADNLPELTRRVFGLGIPNTRMIIVDDNSPDGTAEVATRLAGNLNEKIDVIKRERKLGLGTAYVEGFARALEDGAGYIVQMDADLSHEPEYIPSFLEALKDADVVVGSRYTQGGGVDETWSFKRRALSFLANMGIRIVGGLKPRDVTSGFKGYRRSTLAALDMTRFKCRGFGFQSEVAHACQRLGFIVAEQPIIFADRTKGQSKMSLNIMFEALWRLLLLRWRP
jgi:glycosyltransferase involved in cell wall biosynthesis